MHAINNCVLVKISLIISHLVIIAFLTYCTVLLFFSLFASCVEKWVKHTTQLRYIFFFHCPFIFIFYLFMYYFIFPLSPSHLHHLTCIPIYLMYTLEFYITTILGVCNFEKRKWLSNIKPIFFICLHLKRVHTPIYFICLH